jgi:multicomponent Na+:H+ antiporter subunit B
MNIIVKTASRILFPFILVFGIYIALYGHLGPGGGFPAGVVLATAFILLVIAYKERKIEHAFREIKLLDLKAIAGFALVILILLGVTLRLELISAEMAFDPWGGGVTLYSNILGSVIVATAFVVIIYSIIKERVV